MGDRRTAAFASDSDVGKMPIVMEFCWLMGSDTIGGWVFVVDVTRVVC